MRGPRRRAAVTVHGADQGERDRRTQRRIERKVAKVEAQTHGGYAGPSIIEILETHLEKACIRYLELSNEVPGGISDKMRTQRGVVRGLAEAVALWRNPYTAREAVKGVEREFMRRARKASDAG
jgi:hypothetical protein